MRCVAFAMLTAALLACATAPTGVSRTGNIADFAVMDDAAILVIKLPDQRGGADLLTSVHRADLAAGTFGSAHPGEARLGADVLTVGRSGTGASTFVDDGYVGFLVSPGDYVLTKMTTSAHANGLALPGIMGEPKTVGGTMICFSEGAPTVTLRAGEIALLRAPDFPAFDIDGLGTLEGFVRGLSGRIGKPVVLTEPDRRTVTFEAKKGGFGGSAKCPVAETALTVIDR